MIPILPAKSMRGDCATRWRSLCIPIFRAPDLRSCRAKTAATCSIRSEPNEEINAIEKGKHYGWPYCYDLSTPSPEFKSFLASDPRYQNFCASTALYRPPLSLLPPHAAPLAMFYLWRRQVRGAAGQARDRAARLPADRQPHHFLRRRRQGFSETQPAAGSLPCQLRRGAEPGVPDRRSRGRGGAVHRARHANGTRSTASGRRARPSA